MCHDLVALHALKRGFPNIRDSFNIVQSPTLSQFSLQLKKQIDEKLVAVNFRDNMECEIIVHPRN